MVGKKVALLETAFLDGMANDCGRHVQDLLSTIHHSRAKLGILVANLASGRRAQVGTKSAVFREHLFSKGHIVANGRLGKWVSHGAKVEKCKYAEQRLVTFNGHPRRGRKILWQIDSSTGARPLGLHQWFC